MLPLPLGERVGVRGSMPDPRQLRKNMTDAERALWFRLRSRQVEGHKFRRQHPIGPYVVDFVCLEQRLVVEVDGSQHMDNPHDESRTRWLNAEGYKVLRFWNNEVLLETDAVLEVIQEALAESIE